MKKHVKRIVIILLALLLVLGAVFGVYVSKYYPADASVNSEMEAGLSDETIVDAAEWLELATPKDTDNDIGIVFYPGAKVHYTAYLPLMRQLQARGINCYLARMPFNLAMFGVNRADDIMDANSNIEHWYMAGHSLGGAFASDYASKHKKEIEGVILLGAYLYGDYPEDKQITIYGSNDQVLNRDKITYDANVHVIEGGNHAQFGNYGKQKGDGEATITAEAQQKQTVDLIVGFIK